MNEHLLLLLIGAIADAAITWLYFEYLFRRKEPVSSVIIYFLIGSIISMGLRWFGVHMLTPLVFFILALFVLWQCYHCAVKTALLQAAFLTFVMTIADELVALGLSLSSPGFDRYHSALSPSISMAVLSRLLYLVLSQIGARYFKPHKQIRQEPQLMVLFCSLPILSAAISVTVFLLGADKDLSQSAQIIIAITESALLIANFIFFVLYNHLQRANAEYLELQLSIQKDEADASYYQVLQQQSENQRILIHDIKDHLRILDSMAMEGKTDEIMAYIAQLDVSLTPKKQVRLCRDPILNTVLLHAKEECERKYIKFYCDVRDDCTTFMEATCITAFYGNLLSNAVEGANASSERMIELAVRRMPGQGILVCIINSCDVSPICDKGGRFRSRKRGAAIHGVGLKSIERIVEKHHGIQTMYYEDDKQRFHHIVQFPG